MGYVHSMRSFRTGAVLAHPAAPTLHDELTAEPDVLTTLAAGASSIGWDSGAWTGETPAVAARAQAHGGPLPTSRSGHRRLPAQLGAMGAFCAAPPSAGQGGRSNACTAPRR